MGQWDNAAQHRPTKKLAGVLKRPLTFFLDASASGIAKSSRFAVALPCAYRNQMRDLSEIERQWVRRAQRLVDAVAVVREMAGVEPVLFPKQQDAATIRKWLGISVTSNKPLLLLPRLMQAGAQHARPEASSCCRCHLAKMAVVA